MLTREEMLALVRDALDAFRADEKHIVFKNLTLLELELARPTII